VRRIIQIITFDLSVLNEDSPANRDALIWYRLAVSQHPKAFPTDLGFRPVMQASKKIVWR
jgi:hypothetical protein